MSEHYTNGKIHTKEYLELLKEAAGIVEPEQQTTTAPVKTPAPVRTPTPAPQRPSPFKPRIKPAVLPAPKNYFPDGYVISEAFDDKRVSPYVNQFFGKLGQRGEHSFQKHPLMAMYGKELGKRQFQDASKQYKEKFGTDDPQRIGAMTDSALRQAQAIENQHTEELEKLAVQLVSKTMGIEPHKLKAYLNRSPESIDGGDGENKNPNMVEIENEPGAEGTPIDPTLQAQIDKRVTMNALTQGHALHAMDSLHHLITNELNTIDPRLVQAYTKFGIGSRSMFYFSDIIRSIQSAAFRAHGKAGDTKLIEIPSQMEETAADDEFDLDSMDMPEEENGKTEEHEYAVQAFGITFPVLIQELIKGCMELIAVAQFEDMPEEQVKQVYAAADRPEDEPWYFLVGPQLWKSLLKVVPDHSRLPDLVMQVARSEPQLVHRLLSDLIESLHADRSVDHVKEELAKLLSQLDEIGADVQESDYEDVGFEDQDEEEEEFGTKW
jgi:hypothetical protein